MAGGQGASRIGLRNLPQHRLRRHRILLPQYDHVRKHPSFCGHECSERYNC
jgi:hypothetical protein